MVCPVGHLHCRSCGEERMKRMKRMKRIKKPMGWDGDKERWEVSPAAEAPPASLGSSSTQKGWMKECESICVLNYNGTK